MCELVQTNLKIGAAEHILSNTSEIIEDKTFLFLCKVMKSLFSNDEQKNLLFKQYVKKPYFSQVFPSKC